jgi:hypothetical protein
MDRSLAINKDHLNRIFSNEVVFFVSPWLGEESIMGSFSVKNSHKKCQKKGGFYTGIDF